jgi:hypothetical protein
MVRVIRTADLDGALGNFLYSSGCDTFVTPHQFFIEEEPTDTTTTNTDEDEED